MKFKLKLRDVFISLISRHLSGLTQLMQNVVSCINDKNCQYFTHILSVARCRMPSTKNLYRKQYILSLIISYFYRHELRVLFLTCTTHLCIACECKKNGLNSQNWSYKHMSASVQVLGIRSGSPVGFHGQFIT